MSDQPIRRIYEQILMAWNKRDADTFASWFTEDGNLVGFDGSQVDSSTAIREHLQSIFANHPTPPYVAKVREVRFLSLEIAILRAVAGLVPPGSNDINPSLNTIHTLVAVQNANHEWQAALFQNTPAAWHSRPQDSAALTEELREVLHRGFICQ